MSASTYWRRLREAEEDEKVVEGGVSEARQGEGVSGSCRHLFVSETVKSSQKCTGVL